MKVKQDFILRNVAGEYLLIPTGEAALNIKGMLALTESGGLLYQKLQNECTKEDLVAAITEEYEVSEAVAGEDIDEFLDHMRQLDMLVEE